MVSLVSMAVTHQGTTRRHVRRLRRRPDGDIRYWYKATPKASVDLRNDRRVPGRAYA